MRTTFNWLKEYVDFDLSPQELADRLDLTGTEVESLAYLGDGLEKVVVGEIKGIKAHPDANRLTYCRVETAPGKTTNIVCGAKNIKVGDRVPVALPGAVLPNGAEIRASKIRGLTSEGMMCSAAELELGKDSSGILILPPTATVGAPVSQALELEDWLLELEVTPNRPDCLGVVGLAREVAVITGGKLKIPKVKLIENGDFTKAQVEVEIKDPDLCSRYVARLVKEVKIDPSPIWLARRLDAIGVRPINNVVDVTNYVMMETGQPLHAFDFDLIKGNKIIVRRAKPKEVLVTIDHVKRSLDQEMLIIADAKHPLALAGVMGGFDSEISEQTTTVLLESANFLATNIMRTSRSLGLISESSYRFEKGVDIGGCLYAADRAAQLISEIAGAVIQKGAVDNYPRPRQPRKLPLRPTRVNKVLGTELAPKRMANILSGLELKTRFEAKTKNWAVTVPTFRIDLEREIDLIEEIARVYGLNNIPSTLPLSTESERGLTLAQRQRQDLHRFLTAAGLCEVINYSFMGAADLDRLQLPGDHPWRRAVKLANPLSDEQAWLRTSLLPGLIHTVCYNLNRGQNQVQIFEMGRVFFASKQALPNEMLEVGGALTGKWQPAQWYGGSREIDFFDAKGIMETIAGKIRLLDFDIRTALHPCLHPGAAAEVLAEGEVIGFLGELHPDVQSAYDIKQKTFVFQLNTDKLLQHITSVREIKELPRYPGIELDLALVVDEKIANAQVEALIRESGGGLLKEVRLFDLYRGPSLPRGKKSLAYSLIYRSDKRTLTDDEVDKIHQRVIHRAFQELGATLRG